VQTVIRPKNDKYHDYRGYAGRIASGVFKPGDEVTVMPSGFSSTIKSIDTFNGEIDEAFATMSVTIQLEDEIDIGRGDMIVRTNNKPEPIQDIEVMVCWLNNKGPKVKAKYILRHTTSEMKTMIKEINYKLDISTLHRNEEVKEVSANDICKMKLRTTKPLLVDSYSKNRVTGSLILVDEATNETVAAGMVV
jgi:sulfate adenylyltransferase subunit 1